MLTKPWILLAVLVAVLAGWEVRSLGQDPLTRPLEAVLAGHPHTLSVRGSEAVVGLYRPDYEREGEVRRLAGAFCSRVVVLRLGEPPSRLPWVVLGLGFVGLTAVAVWRRR